MSTATVSDLIRGPLAQEFEELFREHYQLVYRTAYGITGRAEDAEDVLQTVFLKLVRRGASPDFQKNPKGYLYRAAVNVSLDTLERRRRHVFTDVTEGTPERKTVLGPMLQALLEDRFQLKSHRELEEISMYALTLAKGGLKIKPINEGDCTEDDHAMGPKWLDQVRRGEKGFCWFVYGEPVGPGTMGMAFGGHTMSDFASIISRQAGKPVVDQTGVPGRFRIYLEVAEFALDGAPRGLDIGQPPAGPLGPDIFTAVQEQLGLKLVDVKGPHQYIVIDHVERPSEN